MDLNEQHCDADKTSKGEAEQMEIGTWGFRRASVRNKNVLFKSAEVLEAMKTNEVPQG